MPSFVLDRFSPTRYDIFLNWNAAFFKECLDNFWAGHGDDPRPGWYNGQIGFIEGYILPLAERCSTLVPHCELAEGARQIVCKWKESGEAFTAQLIQQSAVEDFERSSNNNNLDNGEINGEAGAKMNGHTSNRRPSTNHKRRKSLKIRKFMSRGRTSSHSLESSTQASDAPKNEELPTSAISFSDNNHIERNLPPPPTAAHLKKTEDNYDPQNEDRSYQLFLECLYDTSGLTKSEALKGSI